MNVWDWIRALFAPVHKSDTPNPASSGAPSPARPGAGLGGKEPRATPTPSARGPLPTGRVSVDLPDTLFGDTWVILPPQDYADGWRTLNVDAAALSSYSPHRLLDLLADLSPELSRAIWDLLRLCNPGYEAKAFVPGTEDTENVEAQAVIDAFLETLRAHYGSVDVVIGRLFIGAGMRGAFCSELVLDGGRVGVDLATPDPYSVRFRKRQDRVRGQVWQAGQWQAGSFVPLEIPTFQYLPVDPMPALPYGRSLFAPSLFTTIFLLGLLHDIKRVVMQQGYKRMDISISLDQAITGYQQDNEGYETLGDYVAAAVEAVKLTYARLEPDDAFVHSDMIVLNPPAGTIDSDSISAIDRIIEKLEGMAARALKSNSLLMGNDESASETDSNRRWEIHAAGIKSLQHYCETMLETQLALLLQAQGIQARVEWRFAELRVAEELRDAQVDMLKVQNAESKYQAGYYSQDEASNEAVGHDADVPQPRRTPPGAVMVEDDGDSSEKPSANAAKTSRAQRAPVA